MGPSYFDLFVGSFMVGVQFLIVILGSIAAVAIGMTAGWLISWSICRLWALARAQSEDASRKKGE